MQKPRRTSSMVGENSWTGPGTKVGPVLGVKDPVPRPSTVVKRPHIQLGPAPSSVAKQSRGISAQRIELVIITDTEPESSEDDKNKAKESSCRKIAFKARTLLAGKAT
jgi:hypothetical protein